MIQTGKNGNFINSSVKTGLFIKCPYPEMIEATAHAGFHFAVVDMEHTTIGPRELYPLKLAAEARGLEFVVRIPQITESYFKWCLDLGVEYIQVPFVQTRQDAEKCIKYSFFYPKGERGLCRFVRAAEFSSKDKADYLSDSFQQPKLILQIEGQMGFDNIDEILKVENIYGIFVGVYDLSQSLGRPGDINHPEVSSALLKISEKCKEKNVKVGTFTDTPEGLKARTRDQFDFVEYASDLNMFLQGARELRRLLADSLRKN